MTIVFVIMSVVNVKLGFEDGQCPTNVTVEYEHTRHFWTSVSLLFCKQKLF